MSQDLERGKMSEDSEQGHELNALATTHSHVSGTVDVEAAAPAQAVKVEVLTEAEDPQNWPKAKKALHVYVLSWLALATTFGVSSFSVAIKDLAAEFNISTELATVPLTLYVVGQAFGPCLAAPLSETYGRKGVFLITSPLGILFTLGVGFSKNIASVCILRFFAGVFGSPSLSVGGGIIADILSPVHRSGATSLWTGTALLGTSLGPILCGYAVEHLNWRWTQWIFIFVFLAGWIPSLFTSESYKKILLARKAKKNGMVAPGPKLSPIAKAKFFVTITLLRPFAMLFLEPIVLFLSVYLAVVFSILFSYFDAFPIVFAGVYGFSLGQTGVSFFGLFIGVGAGIGITIWIDRITFVKRVRQQLEKGVTTPVAPEYRLYPAMIGAALISGSMFWFGWTARVDIHWICAEIASFFFGIGVIALSSPSLQYLLDAYGPLYGASAVGANNLARYLAGGVSVLYTRQMYSALGIGWATSLLAFVTVLLLPVPFILFKYGKALRDRSQYNVPPEKK